MKLEQQTFRRGSTTYYWSSKFFPKHVRADVLKLYSFVRVADDYVDEKPTQPEAFQELCDLWDKKIAFGKCSELNRRVVQNMRDVAAKHNFENAWIKAFLAAMKADLEPKPHKTLQESLQYTYGSAEVIGLMMSRIMELPKEADEFAVLQGRAMQWINFIRDINEDDGLGRSYFPQEDLERYGLVKLSYAEAKAKPDAFRVFIAHELQRYKDWQKEARKGYKYIPRASRAPLKTAADMYDWTANEIAHDPFIIFDKKVKPSKFRVVRKGVGNQIRG